LEIEAHYKISRKLQAIKHKNICMYVCLKDVTHFVFLSRPIDLQSFCH
jgi:hypothetical protein